MPLDEILQYSNMEVRRFYTYLFYYLVHQNYLKAFGNEFLDTIFATLFTT